MTLGVMFLLLGASMVPIGLLDHRQLVRLMKEVRGPQPVRVEIRTGDKIT